jgi:hypothetical protein
MSQYLRPRMQDVPHEGTLFFREISKARRLLQAHHVLSRVKNERRLALSCRRTHLTLAFVSGAAPVVLPLLPRSASHFLSEPCPQPHRQLWASDSALPNLFVAHNNKWGHDRWPNPS